MSSMFRGKESESSRQGYPREGLESTRWSPPAIVGHKQYGVLRRKMQFFADRLCVNSL